MVLDNHVLNDLWIILQFMVASIFDPSGLGIFQNQRITAIERPMNPLCHGSFSAGFCCVVESIMLFELIMGFQSFFCKEIFQIFTDVDWHIYVSKNITREIYQRERPKVLHKTLPMNNIQMDTESLNILCTVLLF